MSEASEPWGWIQPLDTNVGLSSIVLQQPDHGIGRHELSPSRKALSKLHFQVEQRGGLITITDHSTNGTYVNGTRLPRERPRQLVHGDVLTLLNANVPLVRQQAAQIHQPAAG